MSPAIEAAVVLASLLVITNKNWYLPRRYEEKLERWQYLHPLLAGIVRYVSYVAVAICAMAMIALAFNPAAFAERMRVPSLNDNCVSFERFARQVAHAYRSGSYDEETLWDQIAEAAWPDLTLDEAVLSREIVRRIYAGQAPRPSWWGC